MIRRRSLLLAATLAACAALLGFLVGWLRHAPDPAADGAALLYAQTWPGVAGQPIALQNYRGKPLVVNFWATWCPPCVEEIPEFSRVATEFSGKGISFVGIAIDNADNVKEFAKSIPSSYPSLIAGAGAIELARALGNQAGGLPYTLVIDAQGKIRASRLGRMHEAELRAALAGLEPGNPAPNPAQASTKP